VCLSVCWSASISLEPRTRTSAICLRTLPMVVSPMTRSSSGRRIVFSNMAENYELTIMLSLNIPSIRHTSNIRLHSRETIPSVNQQRSRQYSDALSVWWLCAGELKINNSNNISELGRRICVHTGDVRKTSYLFQRISIMLQRFNSVLLHDTLPADLPDL